MIHPPQLKTIYDDIRYTCPVYVLDHVITKSYSIAHHTTKSYCPHTFQLDQQLT